MSWKSARNPGMCRAMLEQCQICVAPCWNNAKYVSRTTEWNVVRDQGYNFISNVLAGCS